MAAFVKYKKKDGKDVPFRMAKAAFGWCTVMNKRESELCLGLMFQWAATFIATDL